MPESTAVARAVVTFAPWPALCLGLALRLLVLQFMPDPDFPDARSFVTAGRDLFTEGVIGVHIYMPLYPIWTYLWGGGWGLRLADIGLSVLTIWVIHDLTLAVLQDPRAARIAALVSAVYPHFLFYSVVGLTETAYMFVVCSAFLALYQRRFLGGSALIVLSILIRPTLDLLAPVLIAMFALIVHRETAAVAGRKMFVYGLVYVALMAPWWAHNHAKYDTFVRLNLGDGVVLFSGNNELNQSGGGVDGSAKGDDMDRTPFASIRDPIAQNRAYKDAATEFIRNDPGRFLELAGIKFVRFWRLWPYAPEYERLTIIVVSVLSYGVMLALALLFLAREGRARLRQISPPLTMAAYLTLVHMITIGSIRYRLPLEPFLIVFGSRALSELARHVSPIDRAVDRMAI